MCLNNIITNNYGNKVVYKWQLKTIAEALQYDYKAAQRGGPLQ